MTTSEQESMLSGGSATEPTTIKIELGVLKTSATALLSRWISKSTVNLKIYTNPLRPVIREDELKDIQEDEYYDDTLESPESRYRKIISGMILEEFKRISIVRYIEVWNGIFKVNRDYLSRALSSTPEHKKVIAGLFGAFNGKVFQKIAEDWQVVNFEKLYPRVKRLPQEGVDNIRSVFRESKKK